MLRYCVEEKDGNHFCVTERAHTKIYCVCVFSDGRGEGPLFLIG